MGVHPEPAPCADDAGRLVPEAGADTIRWLTARDGCHSRPQGRRRHARTTALVTSLSRKAVAALAVGVAFAACLPQDALAPAAEAHDRIDFSAARPPAPSGGAMPNWRGPTLVEETPSTAALIRDDLERLRQELREQVQGGGTPGGHVLERRRARHRDGVAPGHARPREVHPRGLPKGGPLVGCIAAPGRHPG
ncbi:hypothetical protein [Methylobacterium indicum]|uniref:hypothetical protein n=1 Tax=Methylobacterium indicum TaxID=1775910 RepID=UPI001FCAB471|nr:hypothetical protein [Methylobacterium indicum]